MKYDLVLEGRVLDDGQLVSSAICILDGRIEAVKRIAPSISETGELRRYGKALLMPGAVDTHVHFRDPGQTRKEDFASGSASAAFGGVTTIIDMPNNSPPITNGSELGKKLDIVRKKAHVDFGLYVMITPETDPIGLKDLLEGSGIRPTALKAFLGRSTNSLVFDPISDLSSLAGPIGDTNTILAVHPESGRYLKEGPMDDDPKGVLRKHDSNRPPMAERMAVGEAANALGKASTNLHLLHISTGDGIEASKGTGATVEVTPHHLFMDIKWAEANLENEALGKMNPPLRDTDHRASLWRALNDGTVDTIGSDHAPHLIDEKSVGLNSPSGVPGVETMLPLLLDSVKGQMTSLERVQHLLCGSPARRFSLGGKGSISAGHDADISVVDLSSSRRIRGEDLHSKCGWTPFEGLYGIFPQAVYSRGELIVENEVLCSRPGRGHYLSSVP
ncbi:MAG: dihydroorotase [Thermoplasmata archaeon]|nr:dihydroorotase [Thermoplasmata archaeon]